MMQPTSCYDDSFGRIRREWVFRDHNSVFRPMMMSAVLDRQELDLQACRVQDGRLLMSDAFKIKSIVKIHLQKFIKCRTIQQPIR